MGASPGRRGRPIARRPVHLTSLKPLAQVPGSLDTFLGDGNQGNLWGRLYAWRVHKIPCDSDKRLTDYDDKPCCAMSSSALTVAVATALPPFRPCTVITGVSRVSACSLLSTTATKPTGIATISPGCTRPWRTHVHSVSSAVGAFPMTYTAGPTSVTALCMA